MSARDPRLDEIMEAAWRRAEDGDGINADIAAGQLLATIHNLRVEVSEAEAARDYHYRAACAARDQLSRLAVVVGSLARQADASADLAAELSRLAARADDWLDGRVPGSHRIHTVSHLRPIDCQWPDGYVPPEWDEVVEPRLDAIIEAAEDAIIRRAEDGYDEPGDDGRRLPPPASGPFADPSYIAECEYDAGGGL